MSRRAFWASLVLALGFAAVLAVADPQTGNFPPVLLPPGSTSVGSLLTVPNVTVTGTFNSQAYSTQADCASSASPAACGFATAGHVVIAAGATTVQVNTGNVTVASQILLLEDDSVGTRLGVTCNTTALGGLRVTARSSGVSFTVTTPTAPVTNPSCLSYWVIN